MWYVVVQGVRGLWQFPHTDILPVNGFDNPETAMQARDEAAHISKWDKFELLYIPSNYKLERA